jgi:hypothetical protein
MSVGFAPASTAVVYTYGLNDEPTCRSACVARLNCDSAKSRPPTIASTSPFALSTAIIDACAPESCSSVACSAAIRRIRLHPHIHHIARLQKAVRRSPVFCVHAQSAGVITARCAPIFTITRFAGDTSVTSA